MVEGYKDGRVAAWLGGDIYLYIPIYYILYIEYINIIDILLLQIYYIYLILYNIYYHKSGQCGKPSNLVDWLVKLWLHIALGLSRLCFEHE